MYIRKNKKENMQRNWHWNISKEDRQKLRKSKENRICCMSQEDLQHNFCIIIAVLC